MIQQVLSKKKVISCAAFRSCNSDNIVQWHGVVYVDNICVTLADCCFVVDFVYLYLSNLFEDYIYFTVMRHTSLIHTFHIYCPANVRRALSTNEKI